MATLRDKKAQSQRAYTYIDISELEDDLRKDIIEDANAGGGLYGVRVVEESVFGGARAPIYGVYNDGPDADRWAAAKKELGLSSSTIGDDQIAPASVEVTDPRREAAIREAAAQRVEAEAARIRAGEDAEIEAITHGDPDQTAAPALNHTANIVDDTLDADAENEAANAENQEPTKAPKRSTNKAPR